MKIVLVIALALFTGFSASAAETEEKTSLDRVIEALETPFRLEGGRGISDFEADFFQLSRLSSLDREQKAHGVVMVKFGKEGELPRFRWNYLEPDPQEIVSNGATMWVYVPDNRQVIRSDLSRDLKRAEEDPLLFLTGLGRLTRDFTLSRNEPFLDEEGNFILDLKPRNPSPYIQRLKMVVRKEALAEKATGSPVFPLLSSTVIDPAGNVTTIEFRNVRVNRGIPEDRFTFSVPEGVDVLDSADALNF